MLTTWSDMSLSLAPTAFTLAAGGAALLCFLLLAPDARQRALAPLPCPPSTLPIVGNTLDLMSLQLHRLHDWILEQCLLQGGKTWRLQALGAPPLVVVSSVACFEDVLKTQFEVFDKGPRMNTIFRDVVGNSISAVDGDQWKLQRKALVHLFTMRQFRDTITDAIERHARHFGALLDGVASASTSSSFFPLGDAFQRYAFDSFTEIAFGFDPKSLDRVASGDETMDAFFQAMTDMVVLMEMRFHQPDWLWQLKRTLQVGAERQLRDAIAVIDRKVYSIIQRTLEQPTTRARHNVVSLIMDNMDDFQHAVEDATSQQKFLRDVGFTMLAAGKDSTGTTLTWCIILLARAPRVLATLREHLRSELPQLFTDKSFVPSMDTVESKLVYVEAVVRETLRLCPPVPLNAKEANRDVTLCDGTFMKQGTRVYIPSYALARMPSVWGPDAAEFKPERWIDSETGKLRPVSSFKFAAFHAGPRICIGMRFALVELKTTLAYLLSKFEFQLEKDPMDYTYEMAVSFALKGPLRARVTPLAQ